MQISDISRRLGVSPRVIRHYEVAGLLRPGRSENGYRRFSKADIRRAEWIRDLIGAGFSTREIRNLTACIEDGPAMMTAMPARPHCRTSWRRSTAHQRF